MPADARREPLPQDAGHGRGKPPDGLPEDSQWAIARGIKSLFGWSPAQAGPALPPLTASGLRGLHEDGDQDGGVHRPAATSSGPSRSNVRRVAGIARRSYPASARPTAAGTEQRAALLLWRQE